MSELKPCPFCGNDCVSMNFELEEKDDRRYFQRKIECGDCGCKFEEDIGWNEYSTLSRTFTGTPEQKHEKIRGYVGELLASHWNTRSAVDRIEQLQARVAELEAMEKRVKALPDKWMNDYPAETKTDLAYRSGKSDAARELIAAIKKGDAP